MAKEEKKKFIVEKQKINPNIVVVGIIILLIVFLFAWSGNNNSYDDEIDRQKRIDDCIDEVLDNTVLMNQSKCVQYNLPLIEYETTPGRYYCLGLPSEEQEKITEYNQRERDGCINRYK